MCLFVSVLSCCSMSKTQSYKKMTKWKRLVCLVACFRCLSYVVFAFPCVPNI